MSKQIKRMPYKSVLSNHVAYHARNEWVYACLANEATKALDAPGTAWMNDVVSFNRQLTIKSR